MPGHVEDYKTAKKAREARRKTEHARRRLRLHIRLDGDRGGPGFRLSTLEVASKVRFWIEFAPASNSRCHFACCEDNAIAGHEYRIAVRPYGHGPVTKVRPGFFHVKCFENIADFSQVAFIDRVRPVTRDYDGPIGYPIGIPKEKLQRYAVDAGAEILIEEWKDVLRRLIKEGELKKTNAGGNATEGKNFKSNSRGSTYNVKKPTEMNQAMFDTIGVHLRSWRCGHYQAEKEWNFFREFLTVSDENPDHLKAPFTLSQSLAAWETAKMAAEDDIKHSGKVKEMRERLQSHSPEALKVVNLLRFSWSRSAIERSSPESGSEGEMM